MSLLSLYQAVVDRWPLFRGGGKHSFDCIFISSSYTSVIPCNGTDLSVPRKEFFSFEDVSGIE